LDAQARLRSQQRKGGDCGTSLLPMTGGLCSGLRTGDRRTGWRTLGRLRECVRLALFLFHGARHSGGIAIKHAKSAEPDSNRPRAMRFGSFLFSSSVFVRPRPAEPFSFHGLADSDFADAT